MPTSPRPRETDLARIRRWVGGRIPVEQQDKARLEIGVRGGNVTHLPAQPTLVRGGRSKVVAAPGGPGCATPAVAFGLLLWQNRRDRWDRYPLSPDATRDLDGLLGELGEDGVCLFWPLG